MKIVYKNTDVEMEVEVEKLSKVIDIFEEEIKKENSNIIACKVNNEVKALDYVLKENDIVELLDTTDRDGARIYTRGVLFIMAKAFKELYPEKLLSVNYQLSSSMLCELYNEVPTEEMIKNVKNKMKEIINNDISITKKTMSKEDALKFIEKENTIARKNAIRK